MAKCEKDCDFNKNGKCSNSKCSYCGFINTEACLHYSIENCQFDADNEKMYG